MKLLVIYIVNLPILRSKYRYTKIYCKENEKKLILILCIGKGEDKFGSDPFGTDDINIFMVCMNDFFYNGKTKSGASCLLGTALIRCLFYLFHGKHLSYKSVPRYVRCYLLEYRCRDL